MSAEIKVAASFGDTDVGTDNWLDFYVRCQGGLGPTRWKYIEGDTPFEEAAILAATLARRVQRLEGAGQEVWNSIPATYDENDPTVQRHAQALADLRAALAEEAE